MRKLMTIFFILMIMGIGGVVNTMVANNSTRPFMGMAVFDDKKPLEIPGATWESDGTHLLDGKRVIDTTVVFRENDIKYENSKSHDYICQKLAQENGMSYFLEIVIHNTDDSMKPYRNIAVHYKLTDVNGKKVMIDENTKVTVKRSVRHEENKEAVSIALNHALTEFNLIHKH